MKNILYFHPDDIAKFDIERYAMSLNKYAKIDQVEIEQALKQLDNYENLHVSRLVELGAALIAKNKDEFKL